ncbi:MAG: class I SAM-dependent methyltransferase [Gammaproteobacteria bacterium]|jgi:SAM-dependent methyltransferase|nr:class I SAM-dependent methyltransferase [Gammaproteobacteria bacterium]
MSTHEKDTFFATYDWAKSWQDLPWSHDEATLFLAEICARKPAGRALDIGCGAGTDSVFLAQQGWDVTALDFMPKALEFTKQRAAAENVSVTAVEADIAEWEPPHTYDLVLDHGLLHNMDPMRHAAYRACILKALAPRGDFILLHWHPRYPDQPDGKMGPRRVSREDIKTFFAPELQERFFAREEFEDLTSQVGGGMVQAYYWFRVNQAHADPAGLLRQIESTLQTNKVDFAAALTAAGDQPLSSTVTDAELAVILGPGRLGVCHVDPAEDQVAGVLELLAHNAGVEKIYLENLLRLFADAERANICTRDARCGVCKVRYCKRLRQR